MRASPHHERPSVGVPRTVFIAVGFDRNTAHCAYPRDGNLFVDCEAVTWLRSVSHGQCLLHWAWIVVMPIVAILVTAIFLWIVRQLHGRMQKMKEAYLSTDFVWNSY